MKILQVIPYFTPKKGGDVNVCYNLSKHLAMNNHEVTVLTTTFDFDEEYANSLKKLGINILSFNYYFNINLFIYSPKMRGWLKKHLKDFDVVHMHELRSYQNIIVSRYSKKFRIPYIIQSHNSLPQTIGNKKLKKLFDIFWGYKILRDMSKFIAVSNEEVENAIKMNIQKSKISLIYNGMDLDIIYDLPKHGEFKKKYNINGKMILYLGRIHKLKGINFMIKAFANFTKKTDEKIYFVIAGPDSGEREKLEKLTVELKVSKQVKFVGYLDEIDKKAAYVDADLYIHTVQYMGGVAITVLESILCGTPVIVTDDCGEIIRKANCGYFTKFGDINGLEKMIKYVLENSEKSRELVERGKKYIQKNLDWSNVVKKVERIYKDCI
ncbi:MAG: glycosyltransferase [Candidatus Heimdallarchaeum aukensis]|uniref:Glycosyltransferase n=1 Tax=Candidatus Heimdallarchaeum aukensis TaxID=2876573 RepID=A0A9Y1BMQ1_9ARCH|nr:MAG: glycosyltransferase [Candidatus Heimdallarchaeum aukensis]